MKKKPSKKALIAIGIFAAVLLIAGVIVAIAASTGGEKVDVVPVSQIMNSWGGNTMTTGGMVQSYMAQTILYHKTDIVTKVHVQEGDEVNIGDPLVEYDVTVLDLQQKLKKLEVQRMNLELTQLNDELTALKKLKPGAARTAALAEAGRNIGLLAVVPGTTLNTGELDDTAVYYNESPPVGTAEDPYLFLCTKGTKITQGFLQKMLDLAATGGNTIYARVEYRKADAVEGELLYAYVMTFSADGSFAFTLELPEATPPSPSPSQSPSDAPEPSLEPSPSQEPEPSLEPEPSFEPMPSIAPDPGYTAEEISQMVAEKQAEIRDKELEIKKAELEIKKAQAQLADEGVVKSVIKGKVKVAANQDTVQDGETLVSVTGGEGYYVQGFVNELNLAQVQVGDTVHVMNYMNGMNYDAKVVEVSDTPIQTSGFTENPNESAYAFTVHIEDASEINIGEYVEISYGGGASPEEGGQLYIDKMYVREEDGESYMFIAVDGKLKKQTVKTGKTLYGWCIEIREGLRVEDYVAFPYGKLAKNGTKVDLPQEESGSPGPRDAFVS